MAETFDAALGVRGLERRPATWGLGLAEECAHCVGAQARSMLDIICQFLLYKQEQKKFEIECVHNQASEPQATASETDNSCPLSTQPRIFPSTHNKPQGHYSFRRRKLLSSQ